MMKHSPTKKIGRIAAAVLALTLVLTSLCGCGGNRKAYVYNGTSFDEGTYRYLQSYYKYYYLSILGGINSADYLNSKKNETTTYGAYINAQIDAALKNNIVSLNKYEALGLTLSDKTLQEVDQALSSKTAEYGSKEKLNEALGKMGIDYDSYREILLLQEKIDGLYSYLYGDSKLGTSGQVTISAEETTAFYEKHYAAFRLILIRTNGKNVLNEDGTAKTDASGNLVMEEFTQEERQEKEMLANDILNQLQNGGDFPSLQSAYNQDADGATFPNGYLVSDIYSKFSDEITAAVMGLEIGGVTMIQDPVGYEIIQRVALPAAPYNDDLYDDMMANFTDYLDSANYAALTADLIENVRVNEKVTADFPLADADISFFTHTTKGKES